MNCQICGKEFEGSGTICPECLAEIQQPTTSFSPVVTRASSTENAATKSAARTYTLCVVGGPHVGESFYLTDDEVTIGRNPLGSLFLNDRTVSRDHARIMRCQGSCIIQDAGSLNGTYVNGIIVDEAELHEGDEIQIGTFRLLFTSNPHQTEQS